MKKLSHNSHGFAASALVLVVLLLAVVGFAGLTVYRNNDEGTASVSTTPAEDTPKIDSVSDLDKAENDLNASDVDKDLDASALDADIEAIL